MFVGGYWTVAFLRPFGKPLTGGCGRDNNPMVLSGSYHGWTEGSHTLGKTAWLLLSTVAIAVSVLLVWVFRPQRDCAFSGWKQTVGVELNAQVNDLKQVQTKVGLTDSQVREFDSLLRDYAIKYDAACQDVRASRMSNDAYTCLRKNMDAVLDQIRSFITAMEQAKVVADVATQKKVILDSFAALRGASAAQYRGGCTSALDVNPKRISFAGTTPERSVQITNRGNTDLTFSVDGLPEAFDPKPISGKLLRGTTVSVAILRTILPLTGTEPLKFHVRSNLQDDELVEISLDWRSATLWKDLAELAANLQNASGRTDAALKVIDAAVSDPSSLSQADRFRLASCVLATMGENVAAANTLRAAVKADPSIEQRPSTSILSGIIGLQQSRYQDAAALFVRAKGQADSDLVANAASDLFLGLTKVKLGDSTGAALLLRQSGNLNFVQQNRAVQSFANRYACPGQECATTLIQSLH